MSIRYKLLFPILILFISYICSAAAFFLIQQRIKKINNERLYLSSLRQKYVNVRNQIINLSHEPYSTQYQAVNRAVDETNKYYEQYMSSLSYLSSSTKKVRESLDTIKKLQTLTNKRIKEMNKRSDLILSHINQIYDHNIWGISILSLYIYAQSMEIDEVDELYADITSFFRYLDILDSSLSQSINTIDINFIIIDGEIERTVFLSELLTALIILALLLSTFIISILYAGRIAAHIMSIEKKVNIIKNGDLKTRLEVKSRDELGSLSAAFNSMTENLDRIHNELEQRVRKRTAELTKANERLSKLDKLKDDFLAVTSHELRTPLNGIIGIAESLLDEEENDLSNRTALNISLITASAKRLNSLVNDILDFSKIKNSQLELNLKSVDLFSLIEVVLAILTHLNVKNEVKLINAVDPALTPVLADEARLEQVFYNLVGNAIKFTKKGVIRITACYEEDIDRVLISITDTGIGIQPDKLETIFNSFEQADGSISREYGGTGLGLTITKQILELHKSRISVISEVGKGSVFSFGLSVSHTKPESQARDLSSVLNKNRITPEVLLDHEESAKSAGPEEKPGNTVLVVDDEPINIQVLSNMLGSKYRIIKKMNGTDALSYIQENPVPDLILLDIMMPRLSGLKVCRTLRETYTSAELPIIFLTAKNMIENLVAGFKSGASDYITKPFLKEELFARIETQLKLVKQQEELKEKERLKSELEIAEQIQTAIVPKPPDHEELEIGAIMVPSEEVGGDYYDIVRDIDQNMWFAVGDVSGHGLTAGLIMMMAQTSFISFIKTRSINCDEALDNINTILYENTRNRLGIFHMMTMCLLKYHGRGSYSYAGAAHCDIIVYREKSASCEFIPTKGAYLGAIPSINDITERGSLTLAKGDMIVLYSDGIIEARSKEKNKLFDTSRLEELIIKYNSSPAELIEVTRKAVFEWSNNILADDLTMLVIKQK